MCSARCTWLHLPKQPDSLPSAKPREPNSGTVRPTYVSGSIGSALVLEGCCRSSRQGKARISKMFDTNGSDVGRELENIDQARLVVSNIHLDHMRHPNGTREITETHPVPKNWRR